MFLYLAMCTLAHLNMTMVHCNQGKKVGGGVLWGVFKGGLLLWFWVFMVFVFLLVLFCDGGGSGG